MTAPVGAVSTGLLAIVLCVVVPATQQESPRRFRSSTEAVRVDVLVTDGRRVIPGLKASDFELHDEGVRQHITQVDTESVPLNVICVFDASGSVTGELLSRLRHGGQALTDHLRPSDRIALIGFSDHVRLLTDLTDDVPAFKTALGVISPQGRTRLRDAIFAALALQDETIRRTLVLVFSDGYDTTSWISTVDLTAAAALSDVVVYSVIIRKDNNARDASGLLTALASITSGRLLISPSADKLSEVFEAMMNEFRQRYVLFYSPSIARPGWHRVEVSVPARRNVVVTARRGYFAD